MRRVVIIAVLHQRLIDDVAASPQISAAATPRDDKAQFLGVDVLLIQKLLNGLLPQVHLVKDVLHPGDDLPVHGEILLADVDRVLIVGNLCGS